MDSGTVTGEPLPTLQLVVRQVESALEGGGEGDSLERRQMPTCAGLWADFHRRVRSSSGEFPSGYYRRKVPTQRNSGMELVQRLTQVWGVAVFLSPFLLFCCSVL